VVVSSGRLGFDVEAEVRFDLVVPVYVLVYRFELVSFLLVDTAKCPGITQHPIKHDKPIVVAV
jgi:hypothetical protein